jgi:putative acetyltransferase
VTVQVSPEQPDQRERIYRVITRAFEGRNEEAELVDTLRSTGDLLLSLVATVDGEIVGHAAFSRLTIDTADGPAGGVALAPVAVDPNYQGAGVGSQLISTAIEILKGRDERVILVVGNPAYYSRFGFSSAVGKRYPGRQSGPHFLAVVLGDPATAPIGPATYPEAFDLVN